MKYIYSLSVLVCLLLFNCKSQVAPKESSNKSETSFIETKWVLTKLNGDVLNLSKNRIGTTFYKTYGKR